MPDPLTLIVVGVVGLIGLLATLFGRRARPVSTPLDTRVEQEAQAKADKEAADAEQEHQKAVQEAEKEHDKANQDLVDTLVEEKDKLLADDDALNQHLQDVGKAVRGSE